MEPVNWKTQVIAWGSKVSPDFVERVALICDRFGWPHETHMNWLMSCMAFESGRTFSPSVKNAAGSGAVGLIQFMPLTAIDLGTTSAQLSKMSAVAQLDYVAKYFRPYAKRIFTLSDMYMAILLPKYVGASEDSVLFSEGVAYRQNSGLDSNKDGKITKREASSKVQAMFELGMRPGNARSFVSLA